MVSDEKVMEIAKALQGLSPEEQQDKFNELVQGLSPEEQKEIIEKLTGGNGGDGGCPFCGMVDGKIPVKKVYEDNKVMAILDINPATKGHVLVFPKKHVALMTQLDEEISGHLFDVANKLSGILFEELGAQGTNVVVSNGAIAGQKAPHALINIIPRFEGDKVAISWQGEKAEEDELNEVREKISSRAKNISMSEPKEEKFVEEEPRIP